MGIDEKLTESYLDDMEKAIDLLTTAVKDCAEELNDCIDCIRTELRE